MDSNMLIVTIFLILMVIGFALLAGLMIIDATNSTVCSINSTAVVIGGC